MKFELEDYNFEFRCTLFMTNSKLEKLPDLYKLKTEKLVRNLDYNKIRHFKTTTLTKKELKYCENDCLVIYEYIKKELEKYMITKNTPLTSTSHVRRELIESVRKNYEYRNKIRKSINTDGHIYNLLVECFSGGYTHANWIYTDEIIKDVVSYDFTSSYPFVMCTEKYPMSTFRRCNLENVNEMSDTFAYILVVKFKNIRCNYYNNFISQNRVRRILNGRYDNGRIISADELEIVLTDIDFKFILKTYDCEYEILESYFAKYNYLPKELINFILDKYVIKTKYKGIKEKEVDYNLEKQKFNSIYGMMVTNNISDKVIFDNDIGWFEIPLKNEEILKKLEKEKKNGFFSFSIGVWVTAHARYNLLNNLIQNDEFVVYSDTDSLKLKKGFNKQVIDDYNKEVLEKIKKVSEKLEIDIEKFKPKDIKGKERILGVFDLDGEYTNFITQRCEKICVY